MPSEPVNWASVEGLRRAADRIAQENHRFANVISALYAKANSLVNPETFGSDKFFAQWRKNVGDWDMGVRDVNKSIEVTARGVDRMADAVHLTDEDTTNMAEGFGKAGKDAAGRFGPGGGVAGIPPLPAPPAPGGGNNGGGDVGRRPGRH
ncbi:hypothetical protein ABZX92_41590, partial [Lentzea sp. NPDC006480]|uniref:WXG100 family type VII secretion target n=1 Tax=Lentzea sp. NPDC006480 TaxID=3157176 RepID=UPI0033A00588